MSVELVADHQIESLVDLMHEMCRFYNEDEPIAREAVRANLVDRVLATGSPIRVAVACDEAGDVAGFVAVGVFHSLVDPRPDRSGQLLLKELYVRRALQGQGIGRRLMAWVARHALERGCARVDWHVSASNRAALSFYRSLDAQHVAGRLSYRLAGEFLARLAGDDEPDAAPVP